MLQSTPYRNLDLNGAIDRKGRLSLSTPDDAWTKMVEDCFDGWYNEVAKAKKPKLTVKKALRGGIVPKAVRGYTNGNILKAEDETEEKTREETEEEY
jgi:hypothetical protein